MAGAELVLAVGGALLVVVGLALRGGGSAAAGHGGGASAGGGSGGASAGGGSAAADALDHCNLRQAHTL